MNASVREIARISGFSVAAVSKTLNSVEGTIRISDEAREKILQTARSLRYRPSDDIGLLVTPDYSYLDPLTARVLQGVQLEAQERHSHVLCGLLSDNELPHLVRESCVGGVLLLHHAPRIVTEHLEGKGIPYVTINPNIDREQDCVLCDDYSGMIDALSFLHKQGCQRFVFVWPKNEHPSYEKRRRAFVDFTSNRKLEQHLFDTAPDASLAESVLALLKKPERVGFVTFEEVGPFLLSLADAETRARMEIVTVNDLLSARFLPPLSSVRIPFLEMGREAVRMISRKWENAHEPVQSVVLKPELIRRERSF